MKKKIEIEEKKEKREKQVNGECVAGCQNESKMISRSENVKGEKG